MSSASELIEWAAREAAVRPILANRYFTALEEPMSHEVFTRTQEQFFFAVRYFSRPMAALTARMPDSASRRGLVHNLTEEHGADEESPAALDAALAHDRTFMRFLSTLGVTQEQITALHAGSAVSAFNNTLMGVCLMEPVALAFGCLGIIEHAFAGISARIGATVVRRDWISETELVHYKLHAEIDERHAADFFNVVAADWRSSPPRRAEIEDGVRLGLYVFSRLYEELLDEAAPRA